jgi:hypothetical protein
MRPVEEAHGIIEGDRPMFLAQHDPRSLGVMLSDREAVVPHEHMFAFPSRPIPCSGRATQPRCQTLASYPRAGRGVPSPSSPKEHSWLVPPRCRCAWEAAVPDRPLTEERTSVAFGFWGSPGFPRTALCRSRRGADFPCGGESRPATGASARSGYAPRHALARRSGGRVAVAERDWPGLLHSFH